MSSKKVLGVCSNTAEYNHIFAVVFAFNSLLTMHFTEILGLQVEQQRMLKILYIH